MRVPETDGLKVAPINPGAQVSFSMPNIDSKDTKLWLDAADRAGGFGIDAAASEKAKALKQADDLQFNLLVADAEKENRRLTFDGTDGYLNKLGRNALPGDDGVSLQEKYHDERKKAMDEIAKRASNDRVRARFEKWSAANSIQFDDGVSKHVYKQYTQQISDSFSDRATGATTDAINLATQGDAVGALTALESLKQIAEEVAAVNGKDKPDYQAAVGPALNAVLQALMDKGADAGMIQDIFKNNEDLLAPKARNATRDEVQGYVKDKGVDKAVDDIMGRHGDDYGAALKDALSAKGFNPDWKDEVTTKVGQRISKLEAADRLSEKSAEDRADEWMLQHPGEVPPRSMTSGTSLAYRLRMEGLRRRGTGGGGGGGGGDVVPVGRGKGVVIPRGMRAAIAANIESFRRSDDPKEQECFAAMLEDGKVHGLGPKLEGLPLSAVIGPLRALKLKNSIGMKGGVNEKAIQSLQGEAETALRAIYPKKKREEIKAMASVIAKAGEDMDKEDGVGNARPDGSARVSRFVTQASRDEFIKSQLGTVKGTGWLWQDDLKIVDLEKAAQDAAVAKKYGAKVELSKDKDVSDYGDYVGQGFVLALARGRNADPKSTYRIVSDWYQKQQEKGIKDPEFTEEQKAALGGVGIGLDDPKLQREAIARLTAGYYRDHPGDKKPYTPGANTVRKEILRHAFEGEATPAKQDKKPDSKPVEQPKQKPAPGKIPEHLPPRKYKSRDFSFE